MLNQQQDTFCVHYTTIGSKTYGHGTKSAIEAGYSEKTAYSQATRLLKKVEIQQRIVDLHAANMKRNMITVDKILADLEHDKLLARQARQYSVAKGCTELQGKYLAMFTDKIATNPAKEAERAKHMTEEEEAFARIVTGIRLKELSAETKPEQPEIKAISG